MTHLAPPSPRGTTVVLDGMAPSSQADESAESEDDFYSDDGWNDSAGDELGLQAHNHCRSTAGNHGQSPPPLGQNDGGQYRNKRRKHGNRKGKKKYKPQPRRAGNRRCQRNKHTGRDDHGGACHTDYHDRGMKQLKSNSNMDDSRSRTLGRPGAVPELVKNKVSPNEHAVKWRVDNPRKQYEEAMEKLKTELQLTEYHLKGSVAASDSYAEQVATQKTKISELEEQLNRYGSLFLDAFRAKTELKEEARECKKKAEAELQALRDQLSAKEEELTRCLGEATVTAENLTSASTGGKGEVSCITCKPYQQLVETLEEVQTELTFTKYHLEGYTATARSSAQQLTTLKRELRDVQLARDKEVTELKRTVDAKIRTIVQCVDSSVESKEKAEEYERKAKAELQALREQVRAEKQVASTCKTLLQKTQKMRIAEKLDRTYAEEKMKVREKDLVNRLEQADVQKERAEGLLAEEKKQHQNTEDKLQMEQGRLEALLKKAEVEAESVLVEALGQVEGQAKTAEDRSAVEQRKRKAAEVELGKAEMIAKKAEQAYAEEQLKRKNAEDEINRERDMLRAGMVTAEARMKRAEARCKEEQHKRINAENKLKRESTQSKATIEKADARANQAETHVKLEKERGKARIRTMEERRKADQRKLLQAKDSHDRTQTELRTCINKAEQAYQLKKLENEELVHRHRTAEARVNVAVAECKTERSRRQRAEEQVQVEKQNHEARVTSTGEDLTKLASCMVAPCAIAGAQCMYASHDKQRDDDAEIHNRAWPIVAVKTEPKLCFP